MTARIVNSLKNHLRSLNLFSSNKRRRHVPRVVGEQLEVRQLLTVAIDVVTDLNPPTTPDGPPSSRLKNLFDANGVLYFERVSDSGVALNRLLDGVLASSPSGFIDSIDSRVAVQGVMYFTATDSVYGSEIWAWRGEQPELVIDVVPGAKSGVLSKLVEVNGSIFFLATGDQAGLFKLDVSTGAASLVFAIPDLDGQILDSAIVNANGALYFSYSTPLGMFRESQLWRSDGTEEGTAYLGPFAIASSNFAMVGNRVYLHTIGNIVVTDGTGVGTLELIDYSSPVFDVGPPIAYGNAVYFTSEYDIWVTQGTVETTGRHILDPSIYSWQSPLSVLSGSLFSIARHNQNGLVAWATGGTNETTLQLRSFGIQIDVSSFEIIDGKAFFTLNDRATETNQVSMWISDGTVGGTLQLQYSPGSRLDFKPGTRLGEFAKYSGGVAFIDETASTGEEIFRIDTTLAVEPPADFRTTRNSVGNDLRWSDVPGAVQYDVWIEGVSDPSFVAVRRVNELQFRADPAFPLGAYRAKVRSLPVLGEAYASEWSEPVDFVIGSTPVIHPIASPTINTQPAITWTGLPDTVSYDVWISNLDTKTRIVDQTGVTMTSFTFALPLPPAKYLVWVRGTRADGTKTDWSSMSSFEVVRPAIVITSGAGNVQTPRPTFSWDAVPGATSYSIQVKPIGSSSIAYQGNSSATSHQLISDLPAGRYNVFVQAMRGSRSLTAVGIGNPLWLKLAPANLRLTTTGVAWNEVPTAVSYTYELRNSQGVLITPIATQVGTMVNIATPLTFGQYTLKVSANFGDDTSTARTQTVEVFRPAVSITSSSAATTDATPTITWTAPANVATYEIFVGRPGVGQAVYSRTGIVGASHRVDVPLSIGIHQIWVRANFTDGSRSQWGTAQQIMIGPAPVVTYSAGKVMWSSVNAATNYEVWIDLLATPRQVKVVYQPRSTGTTLTLPSTLPKGRYQAWVRAIRAEGGSLYAGLWNSVVFEIV